MYSEANTPPPSQAQNFYLIAGFLLIVLGFVVPQAVNFPLPLSLAVSEVARGFGQLLLPSVVAYLIVRNRGPLAKAKAVFVVGVIMLLVSLSVWNTQRQIQNEEKAAVRAYLQQMAQLDARFEKQLDESIVRLSEIDLSGIGRPETFGDEDAIAQTLQNARAYKAELNKRMALVHEHERELTALVQSQTHTQVRRGALESLPSALKETQDLLGPLDQVQSAYADGAIKLMEKVWENRKSIEYTNGMVVASTPKLRREVFALAQELDRAYEEMTKVGEDTTVRAKAAVEKRKKAQQELEQLLR